jgi:nucleoside-diphosphate-sugar epimerase
MTKLPKVLVTGGAGYVGSVLVPQLLRQGYEVRVLDLYLFGDQVLDLVRTDPNLEQVRGDIRDLAVVRRAVKGCDAVVHLACISNDPSFDLDPSLGRSINFEAFEPLVMLSKAAGVRRFVYASSSSVYGVSEVPDVTENHPLIPLTDYSKYKAQCEPILFARRSPQFTPVVVRPATVCGFSPRQRLDLTVNILTNLAVNTGRITVFGGSQMRPNIHIADMVDLYLLLLRAPDEVIAGQVFNAGYQNHTVADIAETVRQVVQEEMAGRDKVEIVTTPTDDLRSYHISSEKIRRVLDFTPRRTIQDAVRDLVTAFKEGKLPNSLSDMRYFNVKTMQARKAA